MTTNYADIVEMESKIVSPASGRQSAHGVPYLPELALPTAQIPLIRETCPSPHLSAHKQTQHSSIAKSVMEGVSSKTKVTNGLIPPKIKENTPAIAASTTSTPLGTTPVATAPNSPRM